MYMSGEYHDAHPKPDLYGGFLGDGYPLCSELAPNSFLQAGAKYNFIGYASTMQEPPSDVATLSEGSDLFKILATPAATVVLPRTLQCKGSECDLQLVANVQVGSAVYEYVPPACVHLYIYNGKSTVVKAGARGLTK